MQNTHQKNRLFKVYCSRHFNGLGIAALALLGLATDPAALAQTSTVAPAPLAQSSTLTTLVSFNGTSAREPEAGLILSGNILYGTTAGSTEQGGSFRRGTVFSVPITGGTPTILASFNGANGQSPTGNLTLSGSTLYGTTPEGGDAHSDGTVFSVPTTGGKITVLAIFNGANGAGPTGSLVLIGSTLYGTTTFGGAYGKGTVFSVPTTGGTPTVLVSFNRTNGGYPIAGLTLSGNTLYGTTSSGGAYNSGEIFSVPTTGGMPNIIVSFNRMNGGGYSPYAGLTLSGNTFYGTTLSGGAYDCGTIFSVPTTGGTPIFLASFNSKNGSPSNASLALTANSIYGTTVNGGAYGDGSVYSVPIMGGTPTVLVSFDGSNGSSPMAGLTLSGSTLYGTTYRGANGGRYGYGTIFSISIPASTPTPTK